MSDIQPPVPQTPQTTQVNSFGQETSPKRSFKKMLGLGLFLVLAIALPASAILLKGPVQTQQHAGGGDLIIQGYAFNDKNGNGVMDKGEPGIPSVAIQIQMPPDCTVKLSPSVTPPNTCLTPPTCAAPPPGCTYQGSTSCTCGTLVCATSATPMTCGGNMNNPQQCPPGYVCQLQSTTNAYPNADLGGICVPGVNGGKTASSTLSTGNKPVGFGGGGVTATSTPTPPACPQQAVLVKTDANGFYQYPVKQVGKYTVTVYVPDGYTTNQQSLIVDGTTAHPANFALTPANITISGMIAMQNYGNNFGVASGSVVSVQVTGNPSCPIQPVKALLVTPMPVAVTNQPIRFDPNLYFSNLTIPSTCANGGAMQFSVNTRPVSISYQKGSLFVHCLIALPGENFTHVVLDPSLNSKPDLSCSTIGIATPFPVKVTLNPSVTIHQVGNVLPPRK